MKRKKKRIFRTPEERSAWNERWERNHRALLDRMERIQHDLGVSLTPDERAAWNTDPDVRRRFALRRIERAQAQLDAKRKTA